MENKKKIDSFINAIEVSGVIVTSQKSSLKEVEKTIDRLITKHKNFLLLRKEMKLKTSSYID